MDRQKIIKEDCLLSPYGAMRRCRAGTFGPIDCSVVNFDSNQSHPWKFVYQACGHSYTDGTSCLKSRRYSTSCHVDAKTIYAYRFSIFLTDASMKGHPLKVIVFNEAEKLLECTAEAFKCLQEEKQEELIRARVLGFPRITVFIETKGQMRWSSVITQLRKQIFYIKLMSISKDLKSVMKEEDLSDTEDASPSSKVEKAVSYEEFEDLKRTLAAVKLDCDQLQGMSRTVAEVYSQSLQSGDS